MMPSDQTNSLGNQEGSALPYDNNEAYNLSMRFLEQMHWKRDQLLEEIAKLQAKDQAQDHEIAVLGEQLGMQDIQIDYLQAHALHDLNQLEACLLALLP
ncbi:hypothetical protein O181_116556 [Austropuccinia psidii MF-1]|uniref:Uncharacterized protein n=1 Tax=Austropuccinia psidii MF-1 TaxID=1389203 RepID=A0A9Q3KA86_9BASI|nr:hypothetical protein [Austropuccinia psidii MF-1]